MQNSDDGDGFDDEVFDYLPVDFRKYMGAPQGVFFLRGDVPTEGYFFCLENKKLFSVGKSSDDMSEVDKFGTNWFAVKNFIASNCVFFNTEVVADFRFSKVLDEIETVFQNFGDDTDCFFNSVVLKNGTCIFRIGKTDLKVSNGKIFVWDARGTKYYEFFSPELAHEEGKGCKEKVGGFFSLPGGTKASFYFCPMCGKVYDDSEMKAEAFLDFLKKFIPHLGSFKEMVRISRDENFLEKLNSTSKGGEDAELPPELKPIFDQDQEFGDWMDSWSVSFDKSKDSAVLLPFPCWAQPLYEAINGKLID